MQLLGLVWGVSTSKAGRVIAYVENVAISLSDTNVKPSDLEGKKVLFDVKFTGKGSLFVGNSYTVIEEREA